MRFIDREFRPALSADLRRAPPRGVGSAAERRRAIEAGPSGEATRASPRGTRQEAPDGSGAVHRDLEERLVEEARRPLARAGRTVPLVPPADGPRRAEREVGSPAAERLHDRSPPVAARSDPPNPAAGQRAAPRRRV